jgi:hypothetical protein
MAHALAKARAACRPLPSGEALSEMLAAEADKEAPKLPRLLRGWRVGPAVHAADYLRASSSEWEAERRKWGFKLNQLTLPELNQVDGASLPPGISRLKMVITAMKLEGGRRSPLPHLNGFIEIPYLGLGFDYPDAQARFVEPFTRRPPASTRSSYYGDSDDDDSDDAIWYNTRLRDVAEINQELLSQYAAISDEERPRALVSRLWELSKPQMRGHCDSHQLSFALPMELSEWPTQDPAY